MQGVKLWAAVFEDAKDDELKLRQLMYEYDVIRYPALVMARIKNPGVNTMCDLIEAAEDLLLIVKQYTASHPLMMVRKVRKRATPDIISSDSEFSYLSLLCVPCFFHLHLY